MHFLKLTASFGPATIYVRADEITQISKAPDIRQTTVRVAHGTTIEVREEPDDVLSMLMSADPNTQLFISSNPLPPEPPAVIVPVQGLRDGFVVPRPPRAIKCHADFAAIANEA